MSVYDMFGKKYPAVSVGSASTAHADCAADFEYLNSFDKIYLCFDNDEQGKKATMQVATLFPFNKIYLVKLSKYKDANEYDVNGAGDEFRRIWFNSKRFVPENVLSTFKDFESVLEEQEVDALGSYPFPALQRMLRGIRPGETVLLKALEGIGKTEVMGAIEHHLLKTTDLNMGIIHLEEPVRRALQRYATYEIERPVHLDKSVTKEEISQKLHEVIRRDDRVHFYKNFYSDDLEGVINSIRFLVSSCGCKVVTLDHITRLVTGVQTQDERKSLDYISTRLSQIAEELQFALIMISHVNDDGQTRGSRNISKEAAAVVSLYRDIVNPDATIRNTTKMTVEKNRFGAVTGPADDLYFDAETFKLSTDVPVMLPPVEAV